VIETQAGDVSAYYSDQRHFHHRRPDLSGSRSFNAGIRPAINVGISVSRVGGKRANQKPCARWPDRCVSTWRSIAKLAAFAQFGADQLDKVTQAQLARGQRLTEF